MARRGGGGIGKEIDDFTKTFQAFYKIGSDMRKWQRLRQLEQEKMNAIQQGRDGVKPMDPNQGPRQTPDMFDDKGKPGPRSDSTDPRASTPSMISEGGGRAMKMPGDAGIESRFMGAIKEGGVTNPYALAAINAYGLHESGFSSGNMTRTWSDPSQSGQPGRSGGAMSWRNERLSAMQEFTKGASDPAAAQAKFFMTENPDLMTKLQGARSLDEANRMMAGNIKFAGWDKSGGEYAARLRTSQGQLAKYQGDAPARTAEVATREAATREAVPRDVRPAYERPVGNEPGAYQEAAATPPRNADGTVPSTTPGVDMIPRVDGGYVPSPPPRPTEGVLPVPTEASTRPLPAPTQVKPEGASYDRNDPNYDGNYDGEADYQDAAYRPSDYDTSSSDDTSWDSDWGGGDWASGGDAGGFDFGVGGGMWFEDGGYVEDDAAAGPTEEYASLPADKAPVLPVQRTPVSPQGMSPGAAGNREDGGVRDYDPQRLLDVDAAAEATDLGVRTIQNTFGLGKPGAIPGADTRFTDGAKALAHNVGAFTPEQMQQVYRVVDPNDQLTMEQKNIGGLTGLYHYYMAQGEVGKAGQMVQGMILAQKRAAQQLGALAQTAIDNGDLKGAATAIQRGYDMVPDGQSAQIGKITKDGVEYRITAADGTVTSEGKANAAELRQLATGMMDGREWFKSVNNVKYQKQLRDERSVQDFEASRNGDFRSTLDDDQKAFYDKMPPGAQKTYRIEHRQKLDRESREAMQQDKEDARQARFEARQTFQSEKLKWDQAWKVYKEAGVEGRWREQRDQILTENERKRADREIAEENKMERAGARDDASMERLYARIDGGILRDRLKKMGVDPDNVPGGVLPTFPKGTPQDVKRKAIQESQDANTSRSIYEQEGSPDMGPNKMEAERASQGAGRRAVQARTGVLEADRTYQGAMDGKPPKNDVDIGDLAGTTLGDDGKPKPAPYSVVAQYERYRAQQAGQGIRLPDLKPRARDSMASVAGRLTQGNSISNDQAVAIAIDSANLRVPLSFTRDPDSGTTMVRVGPNPPVLMDRGTLTQIAEMRGTTVRGLTSGNDPLPNKHNASPALPGRSGRESDDVAAAPAISTSAIVDQMLGRRGIGVTPQQRLMQPYMRSYVPLSPPRGVLPD